MHVPRLSSRTMEAFQRYVDTGHQEINAALRTDAPLDPVLAEDVTRMRRLILRQAPLAVGTTLYRGRTIDAAGMQSLADARLGSTLLLDRAFASTSRSQRIADRFPGPLRDEDGTIVPDLRPRIRYELTVSEDGVRALDVDAIQPNSWGPEEEMLLPPGTQFILRSVTRRTDVGPDVDYRVVRGDLIAARSST